MACYALPEQGGEQEPDSLQEAVVYIKRATMVLAATAAVLTFAAAGPASADVANDHAACTGLGLSDHAVNDGPGTIADITVEIKEAADFFGFANSGQVISRFSKVHAGTHVPGCENAIEEIFTAGP